MGDVKKLEGRAMLCFPQGGEWFQGYFYYDEWSEEEEDGKQARTLGLFGVEVPVDDCVRCCHGGYREYKLTVIIYESQEEASMDVQKTGGDYCTIQLTDAAAVDAPGAYVHFETSSMLADESAVACIRQAFPSISAQCSNDLELQTCIVCIGHMFLGSSSTHFWSQFNKPSVTRSSVCMM
ncbi:hypothetical protein H257_04408 [Aphanomyces astaci]|uniref:Uncharacterized protein n=1 Tax=Aphanomyces astaci TaxID=112090 RepID=W4GVP2_APHAT|nr:hypothetical protein H257_04408 [Aphanomyces astaci]ETV83790.1 hypothetical protein H257_04408 [Aphanomyces astaci]|eukprot:XP_009827220.1 hypothetical protein H257_04408 [Aphanomyces astaci]